MKKGFHAILVLLLIATSAAAVPSEYTVTDITGWTPAQLATVPYFDRYVSVAPAGAGANFIPVSRNGFGVVAGNRDFSTTWVQGSGAYVKGGVQSDIPAWLRSGLWYSYAWSWTYWDGHDYHFSNGFVTHSPVRDVNALGQVVGYATVAGAGSGAGSSSAYDDHAWLRDTVTGEHFDLTPGAHRADPRGINDRGEITGTWSSATVSHPFRRNADGTFEDFSVPLASISPELINNHGHIAGTVKVWSTPRVYYPFVSDTGTAMTVLPFPSQGSPDIGSLADMNDHDVIVGEAHQADNYPAETNGVRWTRSGGTWTADDLNEMLADGSGDFIIDKCVAVNDAGHIMATGHPDGTDTQNTRRLLLTPDVFAPPAVTTLHAAEVTSTSAVLQAKINAAGLATTWHFEHGVTASYGNTTPAGAASGTAPMMADPVITGLIPHATYHYRATGTNTEGTSDGEDVIFTTAWDWPVWAAAHLSGGAPFDPMGDMNQNGLADLLDYATGTASPPEFQYQAGQLTVTFRHLRLAEGVTLVVQVSDDLEHWESGSSYGYDTAVPSNAFSTELSRVLEGEEGEVITVAIDGSLAGRYARLAAVAH